MKRWQILTGAPLPHTLASQLHESHAVIEAEEKKSRSRTKRAQMERQEAQVARYLEVVRSERLISDCHRSLYDLILKAAPDLAVSEPVLPNSGSVSSVRLRAAASAAPAASAQAIDAPSADTTASSLGTDVGAMVVASVGGGRACGGSSSSSSVDGVLADPISVARDTLGAVDVGEPMSFLLPGQLAAAREAKRLEALCALHGRRWLQSLSVQSSAPEHAAGRFNHPLERRTAHLTFVADRAAGVTNGPIAMLRTEVLEEVVLRGPAAMAAVTWKLFPQRSPLTRCMFSQCIASATEAKMVMVGRAAIAAMSWEMFPLRCCTASSPSS